MLPFLSCCSSKKAATTASSKRRASADIRFSPYLEHRGGTDDGDHLAGVGEGLADGSGEGRGLGGGAVEGRKAKG